MHKFPILFFQSVLPVTKNLLEKPDTVEGFLCSFTVSCITVSMCYMGTLIIRKIAPMIIPLHTEKPPYRFPHTAADCLFAEQVAVCAGAGQRQHQNIILYAIDKQPVRENMTFPITCPIA